VCGEEPGGHQRQPGEHDRQRTRHGGQRRQDRQQYGTGEHHACAVPVGEPTGDRGRGGPGKVGKEDQPDPSRGQRERRAQQPVAQVVVDGHEAGHEGEAGQVQAAQAGVGQVPTQRRATGSGRRAAGVAPRGSVASRRSVALRREQQRERDRAAGRQRAHRAEAGAPAAEVGRYAGEQSAGQPAEAVARDEGTDGAGERGRVDLVDEVGHGDARHTGHGKALEGTDSEQRRVRRAQRQQHTEDRGEPDGADQHRAPAAPLGQRARGEHGGREPSGGQGHREARAGRRHGEGGGQGRQYRLWAVEQREDRGTGGEHGDANSAEPGCAATQPGIGPLGQLRHDHDRKR